MMKQFADTCGDRSGSLGFRKKSVYNKIKAYEKVYRQMTEKYVEWKK